MVFRDVLQTKGKKEFINKIFKPFNNTFGCEVSNDFLPKNYMSLLRKLDLGKILLVPMRKSGLTSSGAKNKCHRNSSLLVRMFGGKILTGYAVVKQKEYIR